MQVECTGRQVTITKALRALIEEGTERIAKIIGRTASAKVVLVAEKNRYTAEVNVTTRAASLVAVSESSIGMEIALREALITAEAQAIKHRKRIRSIKRQPKQEKQLQEAVLGGPPVPAKPSLAETSGNGHKRSEAAIPVTVHSFPSRVPIAEPHVVRSIDAVALRPMTLEEAVKEAEFRDRDVFVFRDHEGHLKILHRKRDGKMELIEVP